MKKLRILLLTIGIFLFSFKVFAMYNDTTRRFNERDKDLKLAIRVLQEVTLQQRHSFVISPFAVYTMALMFADGASDEELKELNRAILRPKKGTNYRIINLKIPQYIESLSKTFATQNSVWANNIYMPYAKKIERTLNATAHKLPKNTAKINSWINKRTRRRVPHLLKEKKTVKDEAYFISTTYFTDTLEIASKFVTADEFNAHVEYYEDKRLQAIKLSYASGNFIQFFMPKNGKVFDFIEKLTVKKLKLPYKFAEVNVRLPPFRLNTQITNMKEIFKKLGVRLPFMELFYVDDDKDEDGRIRPLPKFSPKKRRVETVAFQTTFNFAEQFDPEVKYLYSEISEQPRNEIKFHADRPFVFMVNNGLLVGVYTGY
ncbi:MAG: hypothetical protein IKN71_02995 [Alphaproteobacteria bacterium]|nr:hypothetical protein [Alphaproteobacteria bacterium]